MVKRTKALSKKKIDKIISQLQEKQLLNIDENITSKPKRKVFSAVNLNKRTESATPIDIEALDDALNDNVQNEGFKLKRVNNAKKYDGLVDKLKLDETYTKLHNKVKYDNVKANIPPLEDYNFQADLLMLPETSKGFKYLLVVVDLWSDEFDCEPLKTKEPVNVLKGLQRIFKGKYLKKPYATLGTDGGTEFKGVFHSYLYENSIYHKVGMPYRHKQEANAENLNRLLGRFLNNYLNKMEEETKKTYTEWTDILPQLITELNLIRRRPDENPYTYNYAQPNFDKKPKYKIGDIVYYKLDAPLNHLGHREGGKFRQGDLRYNKFEPRKIIRVLFYPKNIRYILENMPRVSYTEDELLPANNETGSKYKVRKIIGRKTEQGIIKYLVWWSGYLKKDATWEPKTELIKDGVEPLLTAYDNENK